MTEATEPKRSEGEAAAGIADMTKGRQEMVEPKRSEGEILLDSQQSVRHHRMDETTEPKRSKGEARVRHRRYDVIKTRDGRLEAKRRGDSLAFAVILK